MTKIYENNSLFTYFHMFFHAFWNYSLIYFYLFKEFKAFLRINSFLRFVHTVEVEYIHKHYCACMLWQNVTSGTHPQKIFSSE